MSSEGQELKAGHPPATKAGGMRVVTKHRHKEEDADAYSEKYKDTVNPIGGPPVKVEIKQDVVMSSAAAVETPQQHGVAIKAYHDKPHPTHDRQVHSPSKQTHINQPRKN